MHTSMRSLMLYFVSILVRFVHNLYIAVIAEFFDTVPRKRKSISATSNIRQKGIKISIISWFSLSHFKVSCCSSTFLLFSPCSIHLDLIVFVNGNKIIITGRTPSSVRRPNISIDYFWKANKNKSTHELAAPFFMPVEIWKEAEKNACQT